MNRTTGTIAATWGILGVITLLGFAVSRMWSPTVEGFGYELGWQHYAVMIVWLFFMAYSEGYKGFQKGFSPRVASRALYLRDHCTPLRFALAPWFCIGFFHSTKKRKIVSFVLIVAITLMVILFRQIPQPWRGVLDLGVVVGLTWGIIATLVFFIKFWVTGNVTYDPEVVDPVSGESNASN